MIINRTVRWLDCWVAKLELAYKRLTLLVERHCLGSKVVREAREMQELYFNVLSVLSGISCHKRYYAKFWWCFWERMLITKGTIDQLDYYTKLLDPAASKLHQITHLYQMKRKNEVPVEEFEQILETVASVLAGLEAEQKYYSFPWTKRKWALKY